ncbi:MAG TPA: hypothetical protein VFA70_06300 [Dehalococcoidia bacterium]|nr:hypothetical protein [Dehalococcoidia bacterium]
MSVTAQLLSGTYLPESDLTFTLTGAVDSSNTLLTGSTAVCKLTIWSGRWNGPLLVNAASMTYSGTPGTFSYNALASSLPNGAVLYAIGQIFDSTGATLHFTQPMLLVPVW